MPVLVMKFGGTSVANLDRIRRAAKRVGVEVAKGYDVIVIVSAMSGKTNELVGWVEETSPLFDAREYDAVVASELAKAVVRDDPEAGRTLAVDLLGHGLADMRNRGAAWLLAMGALAERRGHGDLAASLRAEILALPEGTLDPGSLGVGHDVSQAALVEALTASFLSGGEALEEQWFAELVPDAIENP